MADKTDFCWRSCLIVQILSVVLAIRGNPVYTDALVQTELLIDTRRQK